METFELDAEEKLTSWERESGKRVSLRVKTKAEEYLSEKGLELKDLTADQQKHVLNNIRGKLARRWFIPIWILTALIVVGTSVMGVSLFVKVSNMLGEPLGADMVLKDGTEQFLMFSEEGRKQIEQGMLLRVMWGGILVSAIWSAVVALGGVTSQLFGNWATNKVLEAFLPAVSSKKDT